MTQLFFGFPQVFKKLFVAYSLMMIIICVHILWRLSNQLATSPHTMQLDVTFHDVNCSNLMTLRNVFDKRNNGKTTDFFFLNPPSSHFLVSTSGNTLRTSRNHQRHDRVLPNTSRTSSPSIFYIYIKYRPPNMVRDVSWSSFCWCELDRS